MEYVEQSSLRAGKVKKERGRMNSGCDGYFMLRTVSLREKRVHAVV
jgi:hypothetical protein